MISLAPSESPESRPKVPGSLVVGELNGRPQYYRGCREVLAGRLTPESVWATATFRPLSGAWMRLVAECIWLRQNFRAVTDPGIINRKPERIAIKAAPRDGTFREAMASLGMPASRLEELGVVNSLKADDRVTRGTPVKGIVR